MTTLQFSPLARILTVVRRRFAILLTLLIAFFPAGLAAEELFGTTPAPVLYYNETNSLSSFLDGDGKGYRTYDSFQLTGPSQVTAVTWDGHYFIGEGNPGTSQTVTWQLSFHANNAGIPGSTILSVNLPVASVTREFLFDSNSLGFVHPVYRWTAQLPDPVGLSAGTTYWFSAVSLQPTSTSTQIFGWWPATSPGESYQLSYYTTPPEPTEAQADGNRAFTIIGEPSAPGISLKVGATTIASGGSYNFAATSLGAETTVTVTVTNTGSAVLTGIAASTAPAENTDFRAGSQPPATLAAGATGTFSLVFDPQGTGHRTGTLQVASNASPGPYVIQLSGTGTDTLPPVITRPAANLTVVGGAPGTPAAIDSWLQNHGGATATDNSGSFTWSHNYTSSPLPGASAPITFTGTDPTGNMATTTAQLIVLDQTPPAITSPASNLTIVDGAAGNAATVNTWLQNHGGAAATDNSGTFTWSHNYTTLPVPGTSATITFTARDASSNQSTASAQLIVLDQTPPAITTQAAPLSVVCDAPDRMNMINAWLQAHGTAAATDNSGAFTWTHNFTTVPGACGAATVTFTATDGSGNFSTTPAQLNVLDNTAPVITTPATGMTVESDGNGNVAAMTAWLNSHGGANATDNCGPLTWSHNFTGLANTLPQAIPVTFSAKDACNLSAPASASFTIQDTTPPALTTPATDYYGDCGQGQTQIAAFLASHGSAQVVDIAGPVTWTHNYNGTLPPCEGHITVTFTATDTVGLSVSTSSRFFLFPPGAIWIGPAAGNWADGPNWDDGTLPTASVDAWVDLFDFQNSTATLAGSGRSVRDLHIGAGDSVNIPAGAILEPARAIYNNGTIRMGGGSGSSTDGIRLLGSVTLEGAGKVILQGSDNNNISAASNNAAYLLTIGPDQEVMATAGTVAGNSKMFLSIANQGTITADQGGLEITTRPMTNSGLIRAINGGTLRLTNVHVTDAGGQFMSATGGHLQFTSTGTVIDGGVLSGDGNITSSAGTTLGGGLRVSEESQVTFTGGVNVNTQVTNDGAIVIADAGSSIAGMRLLNSTLLDGSGQVTIRPGASRGIWAASDSSAHILTVGPEQEVTSVAGEGAGEADMFVTTINNGTISANEGALRIRDRDMTNAGLIRAINGGTLTFRGDVTLANADGQLFAGNGGGFVLNGRATLEGGTVTGTGSLVWEGSAVLSNGVHLGSDIITTVKDTGNASTQVTNDGIIFIGDEGTAASNIRLLASTMLDGGGQVVIRGGGTRGFSTAGNSAAHVLTVGIGQEIITAPGTVAGDAYIYATTINNGRVTADRGGLEIQSRQFTNTGTVRALQGGTFAFSNAGSYLTNYNPSTDTLSGGVWEAVTDGPPATLNLQSAPIATIAAGTTVRLRGAGASLPQLSGLTNISGTLSLENGKTLATTGNMTVPGVLQYGLPAAPETTRLAITGNVNFTGTRVNVLDLGMTSGSYLIATWTGTSTGTPVLGSLPPWSRHSLVLNAAAKTLRLEVTTVPPATITAYSNVPGTGQNAGQNVVTLSASGGANAGYILEASPNLVTWTLISALSSPAGTLTWQFTESPSFTRRFYRIGPQ